MMKMPKKLASVDHVETLPSLTHAPRVRRGRNDRYYSRYRAAFRRRRFRATLRESSGPLRRDVRSEKKCWPYAVFVCAIAVGIWHRSVDNAAEPVKIPGWEELAMCSD